MSIGRRLLVRRPSPALQAGELTHLDRRPVTAELALQEWLAYVEVFAGRGWQVHELPPLDEHPDGVFVEDMVVMLGEVAVLASPAAVSRRGEQLSMADCLAELQVDVRRIELPGTLEGGDVLKVGSTVYVGRSTRTNDAGVEQLASIAEPLGFTVVPVPVSRALHLKSALTALPDGTVIGYQPLLDDPAVFPVFVPVPEAEGAPVVVLDEHSVLISSSAPATAELLRQRGLSVLSTPVSQFERLEGCVTCLSVRVR
jgi:dimethylargininase